MAETRYCHNCGEECGWEDRFCTSCRAELRPTASRPSGGMRSPGSVPDPRDALASLQTELGLPAGSLLADRYKILKELGAGGMGRVYLAEDQKLGIPVAVKVLRDILRQDPGSVKRLVSEAKASIVLSHPNIVRLHNFEDGETAKFLVMEYVEGETLAHKIAREGKLSEAETRRIGAEVCRGLEIAHQKKVIHRDMKPGNVLLGKDDSVKIADFGIARLCRDSLSRLTSQQDSGTLLYMAPEQLDGDSGEASDIYSFGVMLYEMLAGDPPFISGEITAQIRYKAPKEIEGLSPAMSRIVMKCLEKKAENRFAGVKELREELDGTAEQRRILQEPTGPRVEPPRSDGGPIPTPPDAPDRQQRIAALKAKGNDAYGGGRFGEAIAAWQEALQLDPADTALNEMLAGARQLMAPPAIPSGDTPVVPMKKPAKSGKKIWIAIGIGVAVFVVLGIIGILMDSGGGPITMPSTLAGTWGYTLLAPGGRIDGRVMISGADDQLHVTSSTQYLYPGPDGMPRQVAESIEYEGSFNGQSLFIRCIGGTVQMAGYPPAAPPGVGTIITLAVSPDRLSMQGQVPVGATTGSLTLRKQ